MPPTYQFSPRTQMSLIKLDMFIITLLVVHVDIM